MWRKEKQKAEEIARKRRAEANRKDAGNDDTRHTGWDAKEGCRILQRAFVNPDDATKSVCGVNKGDGKDRSRCYVCTEDTCPNGETQ